ASDRLSAPATTAADDATGRQSEGGFFGQDPAPEADGRDDNTFRDYGVRPFVATDIDPLSTFALDVDTASYSIGRQWLSSGALPPAESVRVEEYLNSFRYDYVAPSEGLNVEVDGGPSPYDRDNVIIRVGVQAERVSNAERANASLTFVVDTSGSMDRANRLELVKTSLRRLTAELESRDTVAIVTYADDAQVLLRPTSVRSEDVILEAIDRLQPTGSTNLEAGLQAGYEMANESFQPDGINRVVLASDGVANVGLTDPDRLARLIRDDADRGIQLVTVGVGMGNFNDVVMEQLADRGDGFYAYVNDEREAEKLFSDDLVSTLLTVAVDGKIQVEFNADVVDEYRLIGFENRAVLDDDFRNDAVDAGELGAGHQVTALYELKLRPGDVGDDQLGTVQLRWEDPEERSVRETRLIVSPSMIDDRWSETDEDFRLAVTVAAFAELLRNSPHTGDVSLTQVAEEARALSPGSGAIEELASLIETSIGLAR
ncbi:MAG: von Willebrand factor type A domain-containing protein, partial [Acidimicrobiales bacterium]